VLLIPGWKRDWQTSSVPCLPSLRRKKKILKHQRHIAFIIQIQDKKKNENGHLGATLARWLIIFFKEFKKKKKNPKWEYVPGGNPSSLTNAKKLKQMKDKNKYKN
jgi:hypothetical protein